MINRWVEYIFNPMVELKVRREASSEQLDKVFAALSATPRRRIVALLREAGTLRVTDVAAAFEMSLNGVSKHVKVLERAGIVVRRVTGKTHWLSVNWVALQGAYEFLHAHHHYWSERMDALVDYVTQGED